MSLGKELGLDLGDFVLDRDPVAPSPKGGTPTISGPFLLWPNGWMHQNATWYGCRPRPRQLCVRWGPSSPRKRAQQPPSFRPVSVVAIVAYLSYC